MNTNTPPLRISVVGAGYVGLVTGACLAAKGHTIICVDTNAAKIEQINAGVSPIFEPGLDDLLCSLPAGQLSATDDLAGAVAATDVSFVAVGTPFDGRTIDLSQVEAASRSIGQSLRAKDGFHVVVVKSTVVPGTTDDVVTPILERLSGKRAGVDFGVAMNPEFLRQGEALADFMEPDRIVIGCSDERTAQTVARVYAAFTECPLVITSTKTAEMIKYAANSLLATLISFSNEIGNLCQALGNIDAVDVMRGVHLDRRLTPVTAAGPVSPGVLRYLEAGCGFGGSCFPKDVKALIAHGVEAGTPMTVLESVIRVNDQQPLKMLAMLQKHIADLRGVRVAVLGLAFKPGTDDMRESPAIPVVQALLASGADVIAYDPVAAGTARGIFEDALAFAETVDEAVASADAVLVMTSWPEFAALPALTARRHPQPVVIDGRRIFNRDRFDRYEGIGVDRRTLVTPSAASF